MPNEKHNMSRLADLAPTAAEIAEAAERPLNRVECSVEGFYYVIWKGRAVFEGQQIKRFSSVRHAQEFLDLAIKNRKIVLTG